MKKPKTIRFEDTILKDVDAFAGTHKLKDQDNDFDFSNAIHLRYSELLQKEAAFDMTKADLEVYKRRQEVIDNVADTHCDLLHQDVSALECRTCMEKKVHPGCKKLQPAPAKLGKNYYGDT